VGCRGWLKPPTPEEGFWTGFSGSTGLKKKMFSRRDEKTAKEDRNEGVSVPEKRDPGVTPGNGAKPIVIMGRAFSPHGLWAVGPGASPRAGMVSRPWRLENECPYGCDHWRYGVPPRLSVSGSRPWPSTKAVARFESGFAVRIAGLSCSAESFEPLEEDVLNDFGSNNCTCNSDSKDKDPKWF